MVIGLDIGTHSIKVASKPINGGLINFSELRTSLLENPNVTKQDEKSVLHVGNEAIEKYFNRDDQIPYNVELIEGDHVLEKHLIPALSALKIEPEPDLLVALTVPTEKFNEDEELKRLIDSAKKVFEKSKVFVLDEAVCAAAVYKKKHPEAGFLVICDLGKSALKLSLCDLKNDAIQIKETASINQFAWKAFEDNFVRSFQFYIKMEEQIEKKRFHYDCLKSLIALDDDDKYSYIICLEESPGLLENGGIHALEFLSFRDPKNFLTIETTRKLYHDFVQSILSEVQCFIENSKRKEIIENYPLPILVIGAGASPTKFFDFFRSSVKNHSIQDVVNVIDITNPKFTVAEGACKVISDEIQIYNYDNKQLKYDRLKLVNGASVREETVIPVKKPKFGKHELVTTIRVHSERPVLQMEYGGENLLLGNDLTPGDYDLLQSMDDFGKPNFVMKIKAK